MKNKLIMRIFKLLIEGWEGREGRLTNGSDIYIDI